MYKGTITLGEELRPIILMIKGTLDAMKSGDQPLDYGVVNLSLPHENFMAVECEFCIYREYGYTQLKVASTATVWEFFDGVKEEIGYYDVVVDKKYIESQPGLWFWNCDNIRFNRTNGLDD